MKNLSELQDTKDAFVNRIQMQIDQCIRLRELQVSVFDITSKIVATIQPILTKLNLDRAIEFFTTQSPELTTSSTRGFTVVYVRGNEKFKYIPHKGYDTLGRNRNAPALEKKADKIRRAIESALLPYLSGINVEMNIFDFECGVNENAGVIKIIIHYDLYCEK